MKKKLKIIIPIIALLLLGYLGYKLITKIQQKEEVAITLQTVPNFFFQNLDKTEFSNKNLEQNKATIFIYFNSECDYCQHEAENIAENLHLFKEVQILFVSAEPIITIKAFAENYNLNKSNSVKFLYDNTDTFATKFDANSIPYILIYNVNKELVKKQKGQLKTTAILKTLE